MFLRNSTGNYRQPFVSTYGVHSSRTPGPSGGVRGEIVEAFSHHPFVGFQPLDEIAVQLKLRVVHVFVLAAGLGLLHLSLEVLPVPGARRFDVWFCGFVLRDLCLSLVFRRLNLAYISCERSKTWFCAPVRVVFFALVSLVEIGARVFERWSYDFFLLLCFLVLALVMLLKHGARRF